MAEPVSMMVFDSSQLTLIVDAVLVFTVVEVALLWLWRRVRRSGLQPRDYLLSLASGLLLMGALRCVLTPGWQAGALLCLAASGLCHAADLRLRWRLARRLP